MAHVDSLPIIEPFTIPSLGWMFTDHRSVDRLAYRVFTEAWMFHMNRIFSSRSVDIEEYICGHRKYDDDMDRYAQREDRSLDIDAWSRQDNRVRHTDYDGSRPQYFLCVSDGDNPIGGMTITNIDVISQSSELTLAAGIMTLGVPYTGNCGPTWATVYDHILNTALPLADGVMIRFADYELTSIDPPDAEFDELIGLLGANNDIIGTIDDSAPGPQHVIVRSRVT